jgi:hypothetical protein
VQLLDSFTGAGNTPAANRDAEALSLLRAVAAVALEGRAAAERKPRRPIRAIVPLHARRLLERLMGCKSPYTRPADLEAELAATRNRPAEVTPILRALHLATSFSFLAVGFVAMLAWGRMGAVGRVLLLDQELVRAQALCQVLDHDDLREGLFSELPPDHGLRVETAAYRDLLARGLARDRREARDRIQGLAPMGSAYMILPTMHLRGSGSDADEPLRIERLPEGPFGIAVTRLDLPEEDRLHLHTKQLERTAARAVDAAAIDSQEITPSALAAVLLLVFFFPALWVVWAFVFRGGLGLRVAGLALVRSDGRNALRVQCAWRALVVWAPVVAPLLVIVWLDVYHPAVAGLCVLLQALCVLLLIGYAVLALRFPRDCLHDRLAGTYLVPR